MPDRPADVVGFYIPRSDETHFTGELVNPFTGEVTKPPSMTKQEFLAECDINNIIREYSITGQITHISARAEQGAFLDLPSSMDLQESIHIQQAAGAAFDQLPSQVRERFANDPVKFLEFFENPDNANEAQQLGLLKTPPKPPEQPPANLVPPEPPKV